MFDTIIPLYGLFIIIAIISGLIVTIMNLKNKDLKKEELIGLMLYMGLGAIFGGKYYTFITNYERFSGTFDFYEIGLSSYGAVIGIAVMILLFSFQYKKDFKDLIYNMMPSFPLMYSIGKIGCFLAGCCHGIEYNGIFNVVYNYSISAPKGIHLFPVQLLEAILFLVIFLYGFSIVRENNKDYKRFGKVVILSGIVKFLLEFLRMSHVGYILSITQIISLVFIVTGLVIYYKN